MCMCVFYVAVACDTVTAEENLDLSVMLGHQTKVLVRASNPRSESSVWKEHITKDDGVVIYKANLPAGSPRNDRYAHEDNSAGTTLFIKRLCTVHYTPR